MYYYISKQKFNEKVLLKLLSLRTTSKCHCVLLKRRINIIALVTAVRKRLRRVFKKFLSPISIPLAMYLL